MGRKLRVGCLVICALFPAAKGFSAQDEATADLKALYQGHDWFALRAALTNGSPALYRGAVAAAFNQTAEAETLLNQVIDSGSTTEADQASDWLTYLYLRHGRYQKAAAQMDDHAPMARLLRDLPDQCANRVKPETLRCRINQRKLFLPLSINGQAAEFMVDSDANFSFMSESEARSLGLAMRESTKPVHGVTGNPVAFRVALADRVGVGNVQLRNVIFMVLDDRENVFPNLPVSERGAIGLPVLLALRSVRFDRQGTFEIGMTAPVATRNPNLCFDGADPVALVEFQLQELPVIFDTGNEVTEMWPPFARRFPDLLNATHITGTKLESGFGGKTQIPEKMLPELVLRTGEFGVRLHPAHLLLDETTPNSRWYYGRLGLDVLEQARQVTIDFGALTLTLQ